MKFLFITVTIWLLFSLKDSPAYFKYKMLIEFQWFIIIVISFSLFYTLKVLKKVNKELPHYMKEIIK